MHPEAYQYVKDAAAILDPSSRVLEIGGRNVNGTIRDLFPGEYLAIDLREGEGVDVVGDVRGYFAEPFDVIVCCEVLEHDPGWPGIIDAAHRLLADGGVLILTAAGTGRAPHSAVDGGVLRIGEPYGNIERAELAHALAGWSQVTIDVADTDIRAVAIR